MSTNDGGPAFPCNIYDPEDGETIKHPGMSLRAYLAGKALEGLLTNANMLAANVNKRGYSAAPGTAKLCVEMADAVIAELEDDTCVEPASGNIGSKGQELLMRYATWLREAGKKFLEIAPDRGSKRAVAVHLKYEIERVAGNLEFLAATPDEAELEDES